MDAFVVADHRHKIVRVIGRFAELPPVEIRTKEEFRTDEVTGTVEDEKREGRRPISRWWVSDRWKALVRVTAHDSVGDWLETSPPTIRKLGRTEVSGRSLSDEFYVGWGFKGRRCRRRCS